MATATPSASPTETPTPTPADTPTPTPSPTPGPPDLIFASYGIASTVTHDEQSTAGMYIQNAGVGAAGSFAVSFSGECDTYSFTNPPHRIEGLAPGAEDFYSVKFSFPAGETNCYVRAAIDQDNAVVESDESNNTVSVRVTVQ